MKNIKFSEHNAFL